MSKSLRYGGIWPGISLDINQDYIPITSSSPSADPDWRYVDREGHGHFRQDNKYPTLDWISFGCSMGHGDDCDAEGQYECRQCREVIVPGSRIAPPTSIPGLVTYTLTVQGADGMTTSKYAFGPEQHNELGAEIRRVIATVLADYLVSSEYQT